MAETPGREELERLVDGLDYPISKQALIEALRQKDAGGSLLALVERLPDEVFASHAALVSDLERELRAGR